MRKTATAFDVTPIPHLHKLEQTCKEIAEKGFDVHTVSFILYDCHIWQVTIEATDQDLEDHRFLYEMDKYGWQVVEAERHYA
jgi:hypothetical protein